MENSSVVENSQNEEEIHDLKVSASGENFQKFIYELFDKNGILNDLRAYLRGQIVNVLKNALTGNSPPCQKNFSQRLELTYQALNILVAEYLLCLEFNYSLSVFVSEIPLANMVFGFAKKLLQSTGSDKTDGIELRFKENDVWSILNYLGIKCDSEHASSIMDIYKGEENTPLLLCIMRCMSLVRKVSACSDHLNTSEESLTISAKSSDTLEDKTTKPSKSGSTYKCRHYTHCKVCHSKLLRVKDKYKKRKYYMNKMFQQLKSVYETEMEMVREEEQNKVKRSLATHAIQLQKKKDEMEKSFRLREAELELNIRRKKEFLWGLARALRDQHEQMSRAMHAVKSETERLSAKEDSLKTQLAEAEDILKKRGEDMRNQISNELVILEEHLESMKRERDSINQERKELDSLKLISDNSKIIKIHNLEANEDLRSHYDLLKNELTILKKYIETTKLEPKCVIERSTLTELSDVNSKISLLLNNEQEVDREFVRSEADEKGVKTPNQVVNDLKKQKNVNFSTSNLDAVFRDRSRSSLSSEAGDAVFTPEPDRGRDADIIVRLNEENERLRTLASQQRQHIEELSSHQALLQAQLSLRCDTIYRPVTAPVLRQQFQVQRMNTSASTSSLGWRKGAGEELSAFSNAQPRILLPGDAIPFVGVLPAHDNRRHLINQWRTLRRRVSPLSGVTKLRVHSPTHRDRDRSGSRDTVEHNTELEENEMQEDISREEDSDEQNEKVSFEPVVVEKLKNRKTEMRNSREKSPKSVLKEAKENLRNKDSVKEHPPMVREKSPNSVLREAKLRLRKLEIEAEAVEKSYLDYRKRQTERNDRKGYTLNEEDIPNKEYVRDLNVKRSRSLEKVNIYQQPITTRHKDTENTMNRDFEKYLKEYQTKYNIAETHFRNSTSVAKATPIPQAYSEINKNEQKIDNYLETPLTEFRKLYHRKQSSKNFRIINNDKRNETKSISRSLEKEKSSDSDCSGKALKSKHDCKTQKYDQLKTLNSKIHKTNVKDNIYSPETEEHEEVDSNPQDQQDILSNKLRIEIENASETNIIVPESQTQDLVLVVESSIDTREAESSETKLTISPKMTILVSPKRSSPRDTVDLIVKSPEQSKRSKSPEHTARLTQNDVLNAIFHADKSSNLSSVEMQPDLPKDDVQDDYPDDFVADVDNYNSPSDYERSQDEQSPISVPKVSEDDNFWDS